MNYNVLKDSIAAVIKANGNEEITGDLLQQVLLSMVNILGSGYQFMGAAVPTTNPGTPDARVFYIATQAGTYNNFGSPAIVLDGTQIAVLLFSTSWTSVVLSVPTKEYVDSALALKVDKVEGKGLSTNDLTDELVTLINGAFQKEDIAQDLGDSTTKVVSQAAITAVLLQYAKVDGYYSQLTAGAAENLVGRGSVPASFLRRTTGGTADVGTGSAKIAKLMGNSIVWNQLFNKIATREDNGITFTTNADGSITISGIATALAASTSTINFNQVSGHKYLIRLINADNNMRILGRRSTGFPGTEYGAETTIGSATDTALQNVGIIIKDGADYSTPVTVWPNVYDLTTMFGAGKEPTTAAEFEALFPLPYYAYETGKVLPFAAEKLVTTGFNQWDGQFVANKAINASTGNEANDTGSAHTDYIPIFPNTMYWMKNCGIASGSLGIGYYDANKNFVGGSVVSEASAASFRRLTPAGAYFMRVSFPLAQKDNVCINLQWSGYRDGEYEPYELHEAIFDPVNWEDANGNKIFPYGGMHGVGTARDFATPDNDGFIRKATRVFEKIDLGTILQAQWAKQSDGNFVSSALQGVVVPAVDNNTRANIITSDFQVSIWNTAGTNMEIAINNNGTIFIGYSGITSTADLVTALQGKYLYYPLITPVETELAEPVAASYYANDFGTEEWQPANTDEPYTAPCEMLVAYAMNAVDTLRRLPENYISAASFENFCTELATKLGAALNKSITIAATYDSETAEYNYDITIADVGE